MGYNTSTRQVLKDKIDSSFFFWGTRLTLQLAVTMTNKVKVRFMLRI